MIDPNKAFQIVHEARTELQTSGFEPAAIVMGAEDWTDLKDGVRAVMLGMMLAASGGPARIDGLTIYVMTGMRGVSVVTISTLLALQNTGIARLAL